MLTKINSMQVNIKFMMTFLFHLQATVLILSIGIWWSRQFSRSGLSNVYPNLLHYHYVSVCCLQNGNHSSVFILKIFMDKVKKQNSMTIVVGNLPKNKLTFMQKLL